MHGSGNPLPSSIGSCHCLISCRKCFSGNNYLCRSDRYFNSKYKKGKMGKIFELKPETSWNLLLRQVFFKETAAITLLLVRQTIKEVEIIISLSIKWESNLCFPNCDPWRYKLINGATGALYSQMRWHTNSDLKDMVDKVQQLSSLSFLNWTNWNPRSPS